MELSDRDYKICAYYVQNYEKQSWKEQQTCKEPNIILKLNSNMKKLRMKDLIFGLKTRLIRTKERICKLNNNISRKCTD